uniref:DH domain-containing protein n=1 Tax=Oreochromis niloticus TaxID=8128 RepID=A0A669C3V7_ORENI
MFEVLTSEISYLRSLHVLTEHFMESRELEETMIIRDRKTLFSNILKIREVSERFLKDLDERIFQNVVFSDICDIINYHAKHNFPAYIDYVRNQIYQEKIFTELMKSNLQFSAVITRLQESPQCQRLPFMSFLLLPFQRITRIKMLIEVSSITQFLLSMSYCINISGLTVTRSQPINIMNVQQKDLQQLCDAVMSTWTKISEECFQRLVESMSQVIKRSLKAKWSPTCY